MNWFKIFPADILESTDFIKGIDVNGKKLCVIKARGKLYVIQSRCPHAGADLSLGWCSEGHIVCPYHRHEFNLETGRGKAGQGNYVMTYPTELRADGLYVGLKSSWWNFW